MPIDLNSFVFGSGGGSWGSGNTNYGVQSWAHPKTPAGVTTNPTQAAGAASSFNVGSVGDISKLMESLNSINQNAQKTALAGRIPNNPALENQSSQNIGAELAGQVPQDVIHLLAQQGAERGIGRGIGTDGPNANAAYLAALGKTSIEQQKLGQEHLTAADARNPIAPIVDASKYTLTPEETAKINLGYLAESNRMQIERERLAAEAARYNRSGYGGGGGYGGYGGYGYGGDSGWGAEPPIAVGRAPVTPAGAYLGTPDFSNADWLSSLGNYRTAGAPSTYGEGGLNFNPGGSNYSNTFAAPPQTYGYGGGGNGQDPWTYGG